MYAVIESGGKQHRIEAGQRMKFETLAANVGEIVSFDNVLMLAAGDDVKIGAPYVPGAKVLVEVLAHGRGPKIIIIKFRRRKNYRRKQGHRQGFTEVRIKDIIAA